MTKLYELLETKNRKEQEKRVAALIQAATAVIPEILVRFDTRSGRISVIPIDVELTVDQVLGLLDAARSFVIQQERQAIAAQQPQTRHPGMDKPPELPVAAATKSEPASTQSQEVIDERSTDEPTRGDDAAE